MKKFLALMLALMMALSLVACGEKAPAADDTAVPANALEQIKADGVLTVALSPDFAPMEFVDASKTGQEQYVGFDVTLAKFIAEKLGVELVIEAMGFDACQTAVYTGNVPMSISGYSWTEERAANYELSDYYYAGENETEQVLLIRAEDAAKYTKPEDFAGQDVGAQNASLQMMLVEEQLTDANPVTIGDITVGVMELTSGNIEALAVATGNAEAIMVNNPGLVVCDWQFEVSTEYEANVIMIGKGETELLDFVNACLAEAYEAGYYGEWYAAAVELSESENAMDVTIE
ncbi:MAG: transporter substrate-binding domain-containing protein [Oscillospiraceae bacterium]|nr:transporter substrate-binding domain-containing protein [Oscillospiraceae bacterium]